MSAPPARPDGARSPFWSVLRNNKPAKQISSRYNETKTVFRACGWGTPLCQLICDVVQCSVALTLG
jgi:hypothetical protein